MKDFHLRFCLDKRGWYTGFLDLLEEGSVEDSPTVGGAYVLGTADGTMLTYPWGESPIFYIGRADNLRKRLFDHRKYTIGAEEDHERLNWWPRYQYGAAFGADCAYYSRHGQENPQNIEALLVEQFYLTFGSIPVANAQWPKKIKPTQK